MDYVEASRAQNRWGYPKEHYFLFPTNYGHICFFKKNLLNIKNTYLSASQEKNFLMFFHLFFISIFFIHSMKRWSREHPVDGLAQEKHPIKKWDSCFNGMTSNLGHRRLNVPYLILMSSWQVMTELTKLNKKRPTHPTFLVICVFRYVKAFQSSWLQRAAPCLRGSPGFPKPSLTISSHHQRTGYLSSDYLECDSPQIGCHFDIFSTSLSNFFPTWYHFIHLFPVSEVSPRHQSLRRSVCLQLRDWPLLILSPRHMLQPALCFLPWLEYLWQGKLSPIYCFTCKAAF